MRGGAINYFPLQDTISNGADLEKSVHFINVVGHGSLTGQAFMVPENTFILFMGAAGFPIIRRPFQLPSLRKYRFLNTGETPAQWYERTYAAIRDRTFFRDMLFKNNAPYAPDTTAIYEPGDIVQDLTLSFENPDPPYLLMGVWNCPIPAAVGTTFDTENGTIEGAKQEYFELSREYDELNKTLDAVRNSISPQEIQEMQERISYIDLNIAQKLRILNTSAVRGRALQDTLVNEPNNKVVSGMRLDDWNNSSLSEVIGKLGNAFDASKPIRFIVVEACRSIGGPGMNNIAAMALDPRRNAMGLIMRHRRENEEKNAPSQEGLFLLKHYEQRAQQRRRASLYGRRTNAAAAAAAAAVAAAAGAAAGGGGGAAAGAAAGGGAPTVYITPSFRLTVQDLERVADKVPNGQRLLEQLMANRTVSLDELETSLETYIKPSRQLITADVKRLVSGLMPQNQFFPREIVTLPDGEIAIIVEPVSDEGYILYRALTIDPETGASVDTRYEPTNLKKGYNEEKKDELIGGLLSIGVDSDAIIDAAEAATVARLEEARAAEREFAAGLPEYKVKNKVVSSPWAQRRLGYDPTPENRWKSLSKNKQFAPDEVIQFSNTVKPESIRGKKGTVYNIGLVPDGVHKGKLIYYIRAENGSDQKKFPDVLRKPSAGGSRKTRRRANRRANCKTRRR
jgi:hypothetical protein